MEPFSETHHALLFGWISEAVLEIAGQQKGEAIMRRATREYGEERGRRMALRVKTDGRKLDMINYIAYSEWKQDPIMFTKKIVEKRPHTRVHVIKCPWHTAWKENGLIPYGRLYCLEIDEAIMSGFNSDLKITVNGTRPNGAPRCEFLFYDTQLTFTTALLIGYREMISPGKKALLPWEYHVGHLFKTLKKVIETVSPGLGKSAVNCGLGKFAERYGDQAKRTVTAYQKINFDRLP
jgi:hypothetical protein